MQFNGKKDIAKLINNSSEMVCEVVKKYLERKDIIVLDFQEIVDHDDYDDIGSKSNIYDLYVFYEKNGKNFRDNWHKEEWFYLLEKNKYEFLSTKIIN